MIRNTRLRWGEAPRTFSPAEQKYLIPKPPGWLKSSSDHSIAAIYKDFQLLVNHGSVVWGALVQANNLMFSPGPHDSPGVAVYCPEPHWHDDLRRLSDVAQRVMDLKNGNGTTPEEKKVGKWLADERTPFQAHPVPKPIAGDSPILTNTIMFPRKHLPNGVLSNSYFPIMVHADCKSIAVVPGRYWDPDLVDLWLQPN
jgi:hypothetical protein